MDLLEEVALVEDHHLEGQGEEEDPQEASLELEDHWAVLAAAAEASVVVALV